MDMIAFATTCVAASPTPSPPSAPRKSTRRPHRSHRSPRRRRASFHPHHASAAANQPSLAPLVAAPSAPPSPSPLVTPPPHLSPPSPTSEPGQTVLEPLTLRAVNSQLSSLVRKKNSFSRCMALHQQMKNQRIKPDKFTYSLLLTACATVRDTQYAMQIYNELRHNRVPLDDYLRANLLTVVTRSKNPDIDFAMWVFASSPKPSTMLCNILIDLFARTHNITGAESVHRYMNAAGIYADAYTVSALIRAHVATAGPHAALTALRHMWRAGLSVHAAAFGHVIAAFGQLGMIDDAVALFDEMTVFGVSPQQNTFNILIAACEGRHLQKAFEIFEEMKASTSFTGDRYTYHALIKCCFAARKPQRVPELYQAIRRSNFQPNQVSYRYALQAAGMLMDVDLVEQVAEDMRNNSCEARMDTMATFVAAAIRCSDLQAALSHFSNFVSHGDAARNARFFDEIRAALRRFDACGVHDSKHTQLVVDELERSCMRE